jgi:hypothetical protein
MIFSKLWIQILMEDSHLENFWEKNPILRGFSNPWIRTGMGIFLNRLAFLFCFLFQNFLIISRSSMHSAQTLQMNRSGRKEHYQI